MLTTMSSTSRLSRSGLAMVSPSRMDSYTRRNISSNTMFIAVSRTMASDSRIGTPDAIRVPSVRIVRATVDFSTIMPETGILSLILSRMYAPVRFMRMSFSVSQMATGISGSTYQYFTNHFDVEMSTSVIHGSRRRKSVKIFSNFGMMKMRMKLKMPIATEMTAIG